jgi:hypothetical protein
MAKRIYVAGPMRGKPEFNFPAFREAAARLRNAGWDVITPVDLEELDPTVPPTANRAHALRDIAALATCHAIYLLRGWPNSTGAVAERACAVWMDLAIYQDYDFNIYTAPVPPADFK